MCTDCSKEMESIFSHPCVAKHIERQSPKITTVPATSQKSFWLDPWAFDFSESAKFGATGRFPTNVQVKSHFGSFLQKGLESHREAMDVKFMKAQESSGVFLIDPFSVGFVDGQCKALIIQSILAMVSILDFQLHLSFETKFIELSLSFRPSQIRVYNQDT